jgi:hypothetical protein
MLGVAVLAAAVMVLAVMIWIAVTTRGQRDRETK